MSNPKARDRADDMDADHAANADETQERQRNEVTLLESMYPDELHVIKQPARPDDNFELEIHLDLDHALSFVLPHATYPASSGPQVFLSFGSGISNDARKKLRASLRAIVDAQEPGVECVDLIIGDFRQALQEQQAAAGKRLRETVTWEPAAGNAQEAVGLRAVLWMHHLLAMSKRRAIVQLSKELGLAGFSKPGYPGACYVEGEAGAVRAFVDELKAMRWQAIQERATESAPISSLTLVTSGPPGVHEVSSLGQISEGLKNSGANGSSLASFFLESMKII